MGKEVLELTTLVDRSTVNIKTKRNPGGKLYELRSTADMGPFEQARLYILQNEANELAKLKKLTPAQVRQANRALDEMVRLVVLELDDRTVLARDKDGKAASGALTEESRQLLLMTWSAEINAAANAGAAEGKAKTRRRPTGGQ